MLTRLNQYRGINHFLVNEHFFLGTSGNRLLDLQKSSDILEMRHPLGNIISNGLIAFVSDWYGDTRKIERNNVVEFRDTVSFVFSDGRVLCDLKNPNRTILYNSDLAPLWTADYRIPSMSVYTSDRIIFRDRTGEGKIVAVSLTSGEIAWSKAISDIRLGCDFGNFIGVKDTTVLVEARKPGHIVLLNIEDGNVVNALPNTVTEKYNVSLDNFQLDNKTNRLVRPEGEIDLEKMQFFLRGFFANRNAGPQVIDFTVMFPFTFSEQYIFFGIQIHVCSQTEDYRAIGKLLALNRQTDEIAYLRPINENKEDAGIKQIVTYNKMLYVLDSTDLLVTYKVA